MIASDRRSIPPVDYRQRRVGSNWRSTSPWASAHITLRVFRGDNPTVHTYDRISDLNAAGKRRVVAGQRGCDPARIGDCDAGVDGIGRARDRGSTRPGGNRGDLGTGVVTWAGTRRAIR